MLRDLVARLNQMMPQKITFRPRERVLRFFDGLELLQLAQFGGESRLTDRLIAV